MALLGTLIHQIAAQSFAPAAGSAPVCSFATHIHSLGTTPHSVFPVATSVEAVGGTGYLSPPQILKCGANASCATIGIAYGSGATMPTVGYDAEIVFHHTLVS